METNILYKDKYISIKNIIDDDLNYTYVHDEHSKSYAIAILPFRYIGDAVQFLLRDEIVPPWNLGRIIIDDDLYAKKTTSITGGVDSDNISVDVVFNKAKDELLEETGYEVDIANLIYLDYCHISKKGDEVVFLFAVDLTGLTPQEASGDGTYLESLAKSFWCNHIHDSVDPLTYVLYYRLMKFFETKFNKKSVQL
jgi:8-oxo-dGTP pyrophosphatase MutT (NUDIX family)